MTRPPQMVHILIVSPKSGIMRNDLTESLEDFYVFFHTAYTCSEGFDLFDKYNPSLVIVDGYVEDMNAMSFVTILKDMVLTNGDDGFDYKVYLYQVEKILRNTKADFYCINDNDDEVRETMQAQVRSFLNEHFMKYNHSDEIDVARLKQLEQLPKPIKTDDFIIYNIFSPFFELSGDGLDYWLTKNKKSFYGFLFDCTGHDFNSYVEGNKLRALLKQTFINYYHTNRFKKLSDVFVLVNKYLFDVDENPLLAAAIIFHIDVEKNELICVSAGIPAFYVRYTAQPSMKPIKLRNFNLGVINDVDFDELKMSLDNVEEIMFTSDGFSELFGHKDNLPKADIAKHDDVSAVKVIFKRHGKV